MEFINNMELLCMILKNQELIMRALATEDQQYKDKLIDAADETCSISYCVHKSEYMAETLKCIYQIDNPWDRNERIVDFANSLLEEADAERS